MAITLRRGIELGDGKELGNSKKAENENVENENFVDEDVDNKKVENKKVESEKKDLQMDKKKEEREENKYTSGNALFLDKPSLIILPLSFPQRFRKAKLDQQFATFF